MERTLLVKAEYAHVYSGVCHKQAGANSPVVLENCPDVGVSPHIACDISSLWNKFHFDAETQPKLEKDVFDTIQADPGNYLIEDVTQMVGSIVIKEAWNQMSKTPHLVLGSTPGKRALVTCAYSARGTEIRYHFLDTGCNWYSLDRVEDEPIDCGSQPVSGYERVFVYDVTEEELLSKIQEYVKADLTTEDIPRWIKKLTNCIPTALLNIWPKQPLDAAYNMVDAYFNI